MKQSRGAEQIRIAASASKRARLRDFRWRLSYRASIAQPTDLLHDFYIPALRCAIGYDRMAGYFCPASLAAASQGLSGFIRGEGRIRLVVGTNLEPDQVHICLAEETRAQLSARLRHELQHPDKWPLDVRRGVQLLAWMVNKGDVEIKVAFRTHLRTGKPLQFDSTEDGLVPSRWAVLTDAAGDRILVSGRLNESRTAPVRSAENIDVHCDWWDERARQRVDDSEQEFRALWEDRHEAFRVLPLPRGVRESLAGFATEKRPCELDGTLLAPLEAPKPSALEWLTFALIKDAPRLPGGKYIGMETAAVEPWPHQRIVARRLIDGWPYSFLLCDEVGLGKTIESGLAIRSLHLSGYLKRILIATPAHLALQWQREMAEKFFLPFARALPGSAVRHAWLLPLQQEAESGSLYEHPLTVVSTGLMTRAGRREDLERAEGFDLALLDEAHCARRTNPAQGTAGYPHYDQLYLLTQRVIRPKARSLLLATATPMQLHEVEAADLMRLTRRAGAFLYDPSLTFSYYELLSRLQRGGRLDETEWGFLNRCVRAIEEQDPAQWEHIRATVITGAHEPDIQRWLEHPTEARSAHRMEGVRRLLFAAAPLSRTMLRHTRALLEEYRARGELKDKLPTRTLLPIPAIHFTAQEKAVYDRLEQYCVKLADRLASAGAMRTAIGFFLRFLQLRFASSLYAIRCTLERRHDKVSRAFRLSASSPVHAEDEDLEQALSESDEGDEAIASALLRGRTPADLAWEKTELESVLDELQDLSGTPSKLDVLLQVLHTRTVASTGRTRQTIVFTRFFDTLTDLATRLPTASPALRLGCYSGPGCRYRLPDAVGWVSTSREDINRRFLRGEIDILLCTDAASEGLNLQTADLLVNYDLPWNPMKVEQRIGRIDRIGQQHEEIHVLNLCYPDSAEQLVYGRLLTRLEGIMGTVGRQNLSLLPVLPEEFEELAAGRLSFEALEKRVRERLKEVERRNVAFDIPASEQYEMYSRLASRDSGVPLPVTLTGVFEALMQSPYLRALGCEAQDLEDGKALRTSNVPGVIDGAVLTVSRRLYERGSPGLDTELHFATWGEPVFDAVLAAVLAHRAPSCIRKIEVPVPASRATLVGYAVASASGVKLARSLADLLGLEVNADAQPSEAELSALTSELEALAQQEGRGCALADRVEAANEEAGQRERALHYFAAASLLEQMAQGKGSLFRSAMSALESLLADRVLVRIPHIPYKAMRGGFGLLFDVSPSPTYPDNFHVDVPRFMLDVLCDTARREAEALRVGREHLTVDRVVERLRREAEHALAEIG